MNTSHQSASTGNEPSPLRINLRVPLGAATCPEAGTDMQSIQTTAPGTFKLDPPWLFRWTSLITVLGRIETVKLQWGGQMRCTLRASIGDLYFSANRDNLPPELGRGSWVRARLFLRRGQTDPAEPNMRLLSASPVKVRRGDPTTAWTPTTVCLRHEHMRRLRLLLSKMEPGMQVLFMAVMVSEQLQQRFFARIAAMDHHCYPGGLFDCSVQAAELAYQQERLSARERTSAAMACLLFDLGKTSDNLYRSDRLRLCTGLEPDPATAGLLSRALDSVGHVDAALVASVRSLLSPCDWTEWLAPPGITPTLKQCVHQALVHAWGFDKPGKDFSTDMGEKK